MMVWNIFFNQNIVTSESSNIMSKCRQVNHHAFATCKQSIFKYFLSKLFRVQQVIVGSFLPGHQQEQKHKKQRTQPAPVITTPIPMTITTLPGEEIKGSYSGVKPIITSSSFLRDGSASLNPVQGFKNVAADNKRPSPGEESKGPCQSNCEVSCWSCGDCMLAVPSIFFHRHTTACRFLQPALKPYKP